MKNISNQKKKRMLSVFSRENADVDLNDEPHFNSHPPQYET